MAGNLTDDERKWILRLYWKSENAETVRKEWRDTFQTDPPSRQSIYRIRDKFEETGSVKNAPKSGRPRTVTTTENENLVASAFQRSPQKSTRRASSELGIPRRSLGRLMKQLGLKPYRPRLLQHLSEDDPDRRLQFAEIVLNKIREDDQFLDKIIWSDEASFKLSGHVNRHNCVYWYDENPHLTMTTELNQPGVTVWASLCSGGVIGPVFFERTIDGGIYLDMLRKTAVPRMQAMPNFGQMLFQQDGAPPHYAILVREFLDATFPGRWIGRRGSIDWPPRSPDLTPLDFFFWGVVKEKVYGRHPRTLTELRAFITEACQDINSNLDLCMTACRSVADRLQQCIEVHGGHFEHLRN